MNHRNSTAWHDRIAKWRRDGDAGVKREVGSFHSGALLCALLMAAIGILALVFWGASWGPALLLVIGAGCLTAIIYTWITARRIDKQLDRVIQPGREEHQ